MKFEWSDAWILLAVIGAATDRKVASLTDVIACADYINHAIVTRDELEMSASRLLAGGYLLKSTTGLRPSAKAKRVWINTASEERRVSQALQRVAEALNAREWQPGPLPKTRSEKFVRTSDYAEALTEYQQRFRRRKKKSSQGMNG